MPRNPGSAVHGLGPEVDSAGQVLSGAVDVAGFTVASPQGRELPKGVSELRRRNARVGLASALKTGNRETADI